MNHPQKELIASAVAILGMNDISEAEIERQICSLTNDPMVARRLIDWIPEAFGMVLIPHVAAVILPTTFKAKSKAGDWIELDFALEPIFFDAIQIGSEMFHSDSRITFSNIVLRSATVGAVNKALNQGYSLDGVTLSSIAMIGIPAELYHS
jgi:hypothetical protein